MTEKKASKKSEVSDVKVETTVAVKIPGQKGIKISFDERQIPKIEFFGEGTEWGIRDILHVKRLLTREYKRYLRQFIRKDVKKEEDL